MVKEGLTVDCPINHNLDIKVTFSKPLQTNILCKKFHWASELTVCMFELPFCGSK